MQGVHGAHLSSDAIQRILDENQQLILAVVENQRQGKQRECAQYLSRLHKNLFMLGVQGDAHINNSSVHLQWAQPALASQPIPSTPHPAATPLASAAAGGHAAAAGAEEEEAARQEAEEEEGERESGWTEEEKEALYRSVYVHGEYALDKISKDVASKSGEECRRFLERERYDLESKLQREKEQMKAELGRPLQSSWG